MNSAVAKYYERVNECFMGIVLKWSVAVVFFVYLCLSPFKVTFTYDLQGLPVRFTSLYNIDTLFCTNNTMSISISCGSVINEIIIMLPLMPTLPKTNKWRFHFPFSNNVTGPCPVHLL